MALTKVPLHVVEVLEEEYIALHGGIYESISVELPNLDHPDRPGREVISKLNWEFDPSHIRNLSLLAFKLSPSSEQSNVSKRSKVEGNPDELARAKLRDYLWAKLGEQTDGTSSKAQEAIIAIREVSKDEDRATRHEKLKGYAVTLTAALNRILRDSDLFNEERFSVYWLSDATREIRTCRSGKNKFEAEDLIHFNRLLLEDAF